MTATEAVYTQNRSPQADGVRHQLMGMSRIEDRRQDIKGTRAQISGNHEQTVDGNRVASQNETIIDQDRLYLLNTRWSIF